MSTSFRYRVRDPLGNSHEGTLEAATADEARQQLHRDGFQVLELDEAGAAVGDLFPRRVARAEVIYVTNQLAIMVETGISLAAALEGIGAQQPNPTLKKILHELRQSVEQGEDFSAALARYPRLFDSTYVSLVKVSEATGSLGPMLERIAGYLHKEAETRGKVRAAMAYPAVMLTLAIGVTVFLLVYIMPQFTPLFESRGLALPLPTRITMAVSNSLLGYWYLWLVGIAAAVAGFVYGQKTPQGRMAWHWVRIQLPLVGPMTRKVVISRSIRTLGTMLSSGIPMLEALEMTAGVAGNFFYEGLWRQVSEKVTNGSQVCEALAGSPLLPPTLVQMISAGEQTGKLGPILERVSTYYDHEVESSLKAVTSMIEPILITIMGSVVGTIGLALLLPIFSLSRGH